MESKLICELDIAVRRKTSESSESRGYLHKVIPEEMLDDTFQNLIDYMVDTETDELNPTPYNSTQKNLVETIVKWYDQEAQGNAEIYIRQGNVEPGVESKTYEPTGIVKDHSRDFKSTKMIEVDGKDVQYNCLDLILEYTLKGGNISMFSQGYVTEK